MDKQAIVNSINDGEVYRFINKPWNNEQIREVIAEAVLASETPIINYDSVADEKPSDAPTTASNNEIAQPEYVQKKRAMLMIEQQKDVHHQIRKFCSKESIMIYGTQNAEQAIAAATTRETIGVELLNF